MTKPNLSILNSLYASLKNDATATVTVSVPGSITIPGSPGPGISYVEYHTDVVVGAKGAITRVQISSSSDSNRIYPARTVAYDLSGVSAGSPAGYTIYTFVSRISATTLRCTAYIPNSFSTNLVTGGAVTITFYIATFIPPFA